MIYGLHVRNWHGTQEGFDFLHRAVINIMEGQYYADPNDELDAKFTFETSNKDLYEKVKETIEMGIYLHGGKVWEHQPYEG